MAQTVLQCVATAPLTVASGPWEGGLGEAGVSRRLLNLCHIHKGQKYNIL